MTYADARDKEQLRNFNPAIADYVRRRTSHPNSNARRTLFLLPGGTGSELLRATRPYDEANPDRTFTYDPIWLTVGTFLGDAFELKMHRTAPNEFRDKDDRFVIAGGAVEIFGFGPYDGFKRWCENNDIDWFVFGYDWRRPLAEISALFVDRFLAHFRKQVTDAGLTNPLLNFVVVGHSQGGMVVNLIADSPDGILDGMSHAITVAAPFYGYDGMLQRWFVGEPMLNHLGRRRIVQTITSFPGSYALNYLDKTGFDANKVELANDPRFPLHAYPVTDHVDSARIVDPYDAFPARYPSTSGFDNVSLTEAKSTVKTLALRQVNHSNKLFCIRGVKSGGNTTVGSVRWKPLSANYDIGRDSSPIVDGPLVPGDGTQPAWTARLASLGPGQVVTVEGDLEHAFMMEFKGTQIAIGKILKSEPVETLHFESTAADLLKIATTDEVMTYISGLLLLVQTGVEDGLRRVDASIDRQPRGDLRAIAWRMIMNLMGGPTSDSKVMPADIEAIRTAATRFVDDLAQNAFDAAAGLLGRALGGGERPN